MFCKLSFDDNNPTVYQTIEYKNIFFQIKIFSILWAKFGSPVVYQHVRPYTTCGWKISRSSRRTSPSLSPPPWTSSEASSITKGTCVLVLLTIVVQLSKHYLISNKHRILKTETMDKPLFDTIWVKFECWLFLTFSFLPDNFKPIR